MSLIVSALEHLVLQLVALFGEIQMELPCWWDKLLGVGFRLEVLPHSQLKPLLCFVLMGQDVSSQFPVPATMLSLPL